MTTFHCGATRDCTDYAVNHIIYQPKHIDNDIASYIKKVMSKYDDNKAPFGIVIQPGENNCYCKNKYCINHPSEETQVRLIGTNYIRQRHMP